MYRKYVWGSEYVRIYGSSRNQQDAVESEKVVLCFCHVLQTLQNQSSLFKLSTEYVRLFVVLNSQFEKIYWLTSICIRLEILQTPQRFQYGIM